METSRRALPTPLSIELAQDALTKVQSHRHLGVIFSHEIRWNNHVAYILTKATRMLSVVRRLRSSLDQESLSHMYLAYVRPISEYACTAWGNLGTTRVNRLERFQRRAAKITLRRPLFVPSNHDELLATIGWPSLASRRKYFQQFLDVEWPPATFPSTWETTSLPSPPTWTTLENHLSSNSPLRTPLYCLTLLSTKQQILSTLFLQFCSPPQVSHPLKTVPHYSYSHANVHAVSTLVSK